MKTDSEIKNILKNLPEHKLPDNFRESVMDRVKQAAIFDALEYKSVKTPIKRPRYIIRYAGLIAAVLVLGIMWISGTLRQSYGYEDEFAIPMPFIMPEVAEEDMFFGMPETEMADEMPVFRTAPIEEPAFDGVAPMAAMDLHIEEDEPIWSPPWIFIFVLVFLGALLGTLATFIHFKRSRR